MTEFRTLIIHEEETFTVGEETFIDSVADNQNAVVFEDNCETGYFYAVDKNNDTKILDALHIYNVADIRDKTKPSSAKILWTEDDTKAFLYINNYCHAIFDFDTKAGYCRNAFPESGTAWTKINERKLTDSLLTEFITLK